MKELRLQLHLLLRRPLTWLLAAIFLSLIGTAYLGLYLVAYLMPADEAALPPALRGAMAEMLRLPYAPWMGLSALLENGPLVVLLLGAGASASEYAWGTLRTVLIRTPRRRRWLLSRWGAALLTVGIGVGLGLLASLLLSVQTHLLSTRTLVLPLADLPWGRLLERSLRAWLGLGAYLALGLLLGVATRSTPAALGGGVALALGEQILGALLALGGGGAVARWLPGQVLQAFVPLPVPEGTELLAQGVQLSNPLPPWAALLYLLALQAGALLLAAALLERQDLAPTAEG